MVVDLSVLTHRLQVLRRYLVDLDRYRKTIDREAFVGSGDLQYQVLFPLTMAIQACIDIAAHVAAEEATERAETYAGVFDVLRKARLLDADLAAELAAAARARNLYVHRYWLIDAERVHDELQGRFDALTRFAAWVADRVSESAEPT